MNRLGGISAQACKNSSMDIIHSPVDLVQERRMLLRFEDMRTMHSCSLGPAGGCPRYNDLIDPTTELERDLCVRLVCTSDGCPIVRWMHYDCFERWEAQVYANLNFCDTLGGSEHERNRIHNPYMISDLIRNSSKCPCGLGFFRRDVRGAQTQHTWQTRSQPFSMPCVQNNKWNPADLKMASGTSNCWIPLSHAVDQLRFNSDPSFRLRSASISSNDSSTTSSSRDSPPSVSPLVGFHGDGFLQRFDPVSAGNLPESYQCWALLSQPSAVMVPSNVSHQSSVMKAPAESSCFSSTSKASITSESARRSPSVAEVAMSLSDCIINTSAALNSDSKYSFVSASVASGNHQNTGRPSSTATSSNQNSSVYVTSSLVDLSGLIGSTSSSLSNPATVFHTHTNGAGALNLGSANFLSVTSSATSHQVAPATKLSPGNIFKHRSDFSVFHRLALSRRNPYNIKLEDEGPYGNDETRSMLMKVLSARRVSSLPCAACLAPLDIYDQFPLIDGTFFLSPRRYHCDVTLRQSRASGGDATSRRPGQQAASQAVGCGPGARPAMYLAAVCLDCMSGHNPRLKCKWCVTPWDGSSLVVGSLYSYDVFAAQPCCRSRLSCSNCGENTRGRSATTCAVDHTSFSDYSRISDCKHCGHKDFHAVKALRDVFSL